MSPCASPSNNLLGFRKSQLYESILLRTLACATPSLAGYESSWRLVLGWEMRCSPRPWPVLSCKSFFQTGACLDHGVSRLWDLSWQAVRGVVDGCGGACLSDCAAQTGEPPQGVPNLFELCDRGDPLGDWCKLSSFRARSCALSFAWRVGAAHTAIRRHHRGAEFGCCSCVAGSWHLRKRRQSRPSAAGSTKSWRNMKHVNH